MSGSGNPAIVRLGTRKSPLAMAQAEAVAGLIRAGMRQAVDIVGIVSEGDETGRSADVDAAKTLPGKGAFVKALDDALLAGRIDIAAHSAKDVPAVLADGLSVAAVLDRQDPADALISHEGWTIRTLPAGARVGTSSIRRAAMILFARPDVTVVPIRGNVETRLKKIGTACDAAILASAGILRLGPDRIFGPLNLKLVRLDPVDFIPAAGQGIILCVSRNADAEKFSSLSDEITARAIQVERAFVRHLGADCGWPVGAWAREPEGAGGSGKILFSAAMLSIDGKLRVREEMTGNAGDDIAVAMADSLLAKGGKRILSWNAEIERRRGNGKSA